MGRWLAAMALVALTVTALTVSAAARPTQPSLCNAASVRYEWNKGARGFPWVTAGPARARLEGWLYSYPQLLRHARVNQSDRLVLRAGVEEKIFWFSRRWGGSRLTVVGRRVDGQGSFRQRFRAAHGSGAYPSGLRIPAAGCWALTLTTDGWSRRLVVEAVDLPAEGTCDASPVDATGWARLTPLRSRLVAGLGWRTPEGGALLYTGGRTPTGGNTKVLWRTDDFDGRVSGELDLVGAGLDGTASVSQRLATVGGGYWPSIVVIPEPGCWLLTARVGAVPAAAGILVVRVVDP